jgi:hypothetical protein
MADAGVPRFRLMRQDDNGRTFEVGQYGSRAEAEAAARTFKDQGHKQLYWVEETTTTLS